MSARRRVPGAPSFCSIAAILPSRPACATCRRAQRRSRRARLRATAPAAVKEGPSSGHRASGGQGGPVFGPPRQRREASLTAASTTADSIASGLRSPYPTNKPSKGVRERPSKNELTLTFTIDTAPLPTIGYFDNTPLVTVI